MGVIVVVANEFGCHTLRGVIAVTTAVRVVGDFAATLQEGGKGCDSKGCGTY